MQNIKIKLTPRAKQNKVIGWQDDVLRVHVTAPPVAGKANKAMLEFLAQEWNISKSNLRIIKGEMSRAKILEVPNGVIKRQSSLI